MAIASKRVFALADVRADEFGTVGYWDAFYQKRGDAVFHWYVDGARGAALVDAARTPARASGGTPSGRRST